MGSFFQLLHSTRGKEAKKATSSQLINTRSISILPPDMLKLELNGIKPPPLSHQDLLVHTPRTRTPHTRPSSNSTHTHTHTHKHIRTPTQTLTRTYINLLQTYSFCHFMLLLSHSLFLWLTLTCSLTYTRSLKHNPPFTHLVPLS